MHTLSWLASNGTNTVSTETGACACLAMGEMWGEVGLIFLSLIMTLPIGKAGDSQTGAGLAVDLWVSRTEASFSVKRKVFCFFFYVYVIQE